jgi:hypothetical protein
MPLQAVSKDQDDDGWSVISTRPLVDVTMAVSPTLVNSMQLPAAHTRAWPSLTLIMGLQIVLRIRRTMTGEELNRAIATILASEALGIERCRRADWRKRELAANRFQIKCGRVNAASLP